MDQTSLRKEKPEIIVLIGPKGAGKSYIGRLIEKTYGCHFLHVELIFLDVQKRGLPFEEYVATGYRLVQEAVEALVHQQQCVIFETIGIADTFWKLLTSLKQQYSVFVIQVRVPLPVALERVFRRDQTHQIQLDKEVIAHMNEQSVQMEREYDLILENEQATDAQLIQQLDAIWTPFRQVRATRGRAVPQAYFSSITSACIISLRMSWARRML